VIVWPCSRVCAVLAACLQASTFLTAALVRCCGARQPGFRRHTTPLRVPSPNCHCACCNSRPPSENGAFTAAPTAAGMTLPHPPPPAASSSARTRAQTPSPSPGAGSVASSWQGATCPSPCSCFCKPLGARRRS